MSNVEFIGNIGSDGTIVLPGHIQKTIPQDRRQVKVVLCWPGCGDDEAWQAASLAAWRAQDGPGDSMYDRL